MSGLPNLRLSFPNFGLFFETKGFHTVATMTSAFFQDDIYYIISGPKHTANIRGYFIMLASRVVRQMAAGANKGPGRIRKENQRVVRFLSTAALS